MRMRQGLFERTKKTDYFLGAGAAWHSFLSLFSFLVQSTFLSSIFAPPWLIAKAGAEIAIKAEAKIEAAVFINSPVELNDHLPDSSHMTHHRSDVRLWVPAGIAVKGFATHTWKTLITTRISAAWVLSSALLPLFLAGLVGPAMAQSRNVPADQTILLSGPAGQQRADRQELREALANWRANPQDVRLATAAARLAFLTAIYEGDARWLGNARAILQPWWTADNQAAETLYVRALIRQGLHDFDGALADLTAAIAKDDSRPEFRAWRFAIYMVKADMPKARQECDGLGQRFGETERLSCNAVLLYRTGQVKQAIAQLDTLAKHPDYQGRFAKEWLAFHRGEARRVAGDLNGAKEIWSTYLKGQPQPHVIRLALIELLNQQKDYAGAWRANEKTPRSDALLAQAIISANGLQHPQAKTLRDEFALRLAQQTSRGDFVNERPIIVYWVDAMGNGPEGLRMAQESWKTQREPADAVLFAKAALMSRKPQEAAVLLQWQQDTGYQAPDLDGLLQQIRAANPKAGAK